MAATIRPVAPLRPHGFDAAPRRPHLVVIDGGRSDEGRRRRRMYVQRRLVALVGLALVLFVGVQILGGILAGGEVPATAPTVGASRVVAAPGDTLWEIAIGLDGHVRAVSEGAAGGLGGGGGGCGCN